VARRSRDGGIVLNVNQPHPNPQKGKAMKIFIMTDLEGITNVNHIDDIFVEERYEKARIELMKDVNAAIAGYYDAGAEKVYVYDGHGGGKNFIPELLDERAIQAKAGEWEDIIRSGEIDAYAEVGLHAMAGAINAFLEHTQNSKKWFDYSINGRSCGELIQGAAFVGAFNIPMIYVTGDCAVCEEAKAFLGDIKTVAVKRAVGRNVAVSMDADEARKAIYEGAKESVKLIGKIRPYKLQLPADLRLTLQRTDYAEEFYNTGRLERVSSRTVRRWITKIESYRDMIP